MAKRTTATTTPYISLDLLTTILIRLPPKTLLKFLTVSKSWYSLITNPTFIYSHLHHHKSFSLHHLLLHEAPSAYSLFHYGYPFNHRTFLPTPPADFKSVAASFNGLICLFNPKNCNICLWNPAINKFLNIQRLPKLHRFETFTVIGVGFDNCNDDYKVVAFDYNRRIVNSGEDLRPYVQVYSINGGVRLGWKSVLIPDIFNCCDVSHLSEAIFVENLVNWIVVRRDNANYNEVASGIIKYVGWILTFDPRNDSFGAMELPKLLNEVVEPELSLAVIDESLAVIHLCGDDGGYCAIVWKMDGGGGGDGEVLSWKVLYRISLPCLCGMNPSLWDAEEGKVFVTTSSGTLIVFNVKSGGTSSCFDGEVALIGGYSGQAFGYTESLVLLDRFSGGASWLRKEPILTTCHYPMPRLQVEP